eukprot:Hpha_TRINITY_DN22994_c0_g1::TRINITY_DN22994_c0_g1_i1::g.154057::m.154057
MMRVIALAVLAVLGVAGEDAFRLRFDVSVGPPDREPEEAFFIVQVRPDWAPLGAARLREIAEQGVWDDTRFFRVLKGFVAQWGIPADPKLAGKWRFKVIKDDPRKGISNKKGVLTFATSGANTRTSQMFINLKDNKFLDRDFIPVGKVVEGMDVVERINGQYRQRPDQGDIQKKGNSYLQETFPFLSYIRRVSVVEA